MMKLWAILFVTFILGCRSLYVSDVKTFVYGRLPNYGHCDIRCALDTDFTRFSECRKVRCLFDICCEKPKKRIAGSATLDVMLESIDSYRTQMGEFCVTERSLSVCEKVCLDAEDVEVHVVCATLDFRTSMDLNRYLMAIRSKEHMVLDEKSGCVITVIFDGNISTCGLLLPRFCATYSYLGLYVSRVCLQGMPVPLGVLKSVLNDTGMPSTSSVARPRRPTAAATRRTSSTTHRPRCQDYRPARQRDDLHV